MPVASDAFLVHVAPGRAPARVAPPTPRVETPKNEPSTFLRVATVLFPWIIFMIVTACFLFLSHVVPVVVWAVALLYLGVGLVFIAVDRQSKTQYIGIGILTVLATVMGVLIGSMLFQQYLRPFWMYLDSAEYNNVIPGDPAAAHADAGRVVFSRDAIVQTLKSVGYRDGSTYCVAPIMDKYMTGRVQFWAVGQDCCAAREDMWCDDIRVPGARSGVVVFDTEGIFGAMTISAADQYRKSIRMAEAQFDLSSAPDAMLVRWVGDPQQVQQQYWKEGVGAWLIASAVYLVFSIAAGVAVLYQPGDLKILRGGK
mmetsp:Transcript_58526/g.128323  ORF Transcript_58526/g.128323 Transcript_58526/m.128323 type:complete len:312 (+) Transcript_58526:99-1034(+)